MAALHARAVVFDLDGVLIDSESTNVSSARDALHLLGHQLTDEEVPLVVGRHPVDYIPELVRRRRLGEESVEQLLARQHARYDQLAAGESLQPDAGACLAALADAGVRLALATSSDRARVVERLAHHGVLSCFDFLLTREDVARRKPDPEIYEKALARLALEPGFVLVVEDSPHGIAAAKDAGLRCIAVRTPWVTEEGRSRADRVVEGLAEIPALVRAL